jgi:hypothetical protein
MPNERMTFGFFDRIGPRFLVVTMIGTKLTHRRYCMRYLTSHLCVVASLIALGTAPRIAGQTRGESLSGPCVTATPQCTESIKLSGERQWLLAYRSFPLEATNESITRALIIVHGGGRAVAAKGGSTRKGLSLIPRAD